MRTPSVRKADRLYYPRRKKIVERQIYPMSKWKPLASAIRNDADRDRNQPYYGISLSPR
jgi:hypothetical protein